MREITENIFLDQSLNYRPDITARVFEGIVQAIMRDIRYNR
jgi:hypothetical protein